MQQVKTQDKHMYIIHPSDDATHGNMTAVMEGSFIKARFIRVVARREFQQARCIWPRRGRGFQKPCPCRRHKKESVRIRFPYGSKTMRVSATMPYGETFRSHASFWAGKKKRVSETTSQGDTFRRYASFWAGRAESFRNLYRTSYRLGVHKLGLFVVCSICFAVRMLCQFICVNELLQVNGISGK